MKSCIVICTLCFCFHAHVQNIKNSASFPEAVPIETTPEAIKIKTHFDLGTSFLAKLEYPNAYKNFNLGLQKAEAINNEYLIASGNYHLASYCVQNSDIQEGIAFLNKALVIYKKNELKAEMAKCYYKLGGIYKNISDFEKALYFSFEALRINEQINENKEIVNSFTLIGAIYLVTGDYKEAEFNFKKALKLHQENNNHKGIIGSYRNLGALSQKQGFYDDALKYFSSGLSKIEALPSHDINNINIIDTKAILLGNTGSTLRSQEKYTESLDFLFQALAIKKKLKRNSSTAHTCNDIAETYMAMEDYAEAKKYALEGANLSKDESVNKERWAHHLISKCDYALGNYKSAYHNFQIYNTLKDSVFSIQKATRINEMQIQYDTEKRDHQIDAQRANISLLNLQNKNKTQLLIFGSLCLLVCFGGVILYRSFINSKKREIVQQEFSQDLIETQEQERIRIAKDLHDGVGQQITLLKMKAQNLDQVELSSLANNALEEVRSISRDLYPVTLTKLGLTESVEQLLFDLDEETDLFISVEIDNVNNVFGEAESLNFYRFIQESVNNVLKHAHAKTLIVNVLRQTDGIKILIKDNGVGFEVSKMIKKNSLGLKTIAERVSMLKGNLSIKSKSQEGTSILVQIPV